jgi:hypothetical protein
VACGRPPPPAAGPNKTASTTPSDLREDNRYLYTGDDPVNLVDPDGRACIGPASSLCEFGDAIKNLFVDTPKIIVRYYCFGATATTTAQAIRNVIRIVHRARTVVSRTTVGAAVSAAICGATSLVHGP